MKKVVFILLVFLSVKLIAQPEFSTACVACGVANIKDYGAIGDSVTDNKAAVNAAIETGLTVVVPKGYYFSSGAFNQLKANQTMIGEGNQSIFKISGNTRTVVLNNGSEVVMIKFLGSGKTGANFQSGIFAFGVTRWKVSHCWFESFAGAAGPNGGGGIQCAAIAPANSDGGQIISCYFYNNNCGSNFQERSEYVNVTGCTFGSNTVGIGSGSGNMSFSNCTLQNNGTNIKLYAGTNNGHSIFSSCNINHGTTKNLDCVGQTNGYTFSGCNLYDGSISINTSTGIKFIGCDLVGLGVTYTLTITGNSTVLIDGSRFPTLAGGSNRQLNLTVEAGSTLIQGNNLDF